jgi:hypothetical protein
VVLPFLALVAAVVIGALQPDPDLRRMGWAVGLIAFGALQIALARVLWLAQSDNRFDFMSKIAQEAVDYVHITDIDREWQSFNDGSKGH